MPILKVTFVNICNLSAVTDLIWGALIFWRIILMGFDTIEINLVLEKIEDVVIGFFILVVYSTYILIVLFPTWLFST